MSGLITLLSLTGLVFLAARAGDHQPVTGAPPAANRVFYGGKSYDLAPSTSKERPEIPSPYRTEEGLEVLTALTERMQYLLIPVTIRTGITVRPWEAPLEVDHADFSNLARTGLHSAAELARARSITGRSIYEITELGRPGRLSTSGFMAEDEDILSVLRGDNRLVERLGLTHPELARPLLHMCNLVRELHQETGARHTNVVFYGGKRLSLEVEFSRGGQKSIFADGLDGGWTLRIRGTLAAKEQAFLNQAYAHLDAARREILAKQLSEIMTGEMQPFYIYRYGFYEGHTGWRVDPIVIAFMFGLKSIEEIEAAFPGQLPEVLLGHFTPEHPRSAGGSS